MTFRSHAANRYETELTVEFGPTDLVASVLSTDGGPGPPAYLVIDPDVPTKAEVILFNGTFTGTSFATTSLTNRYLAGSAAESGITHDIGAKVISAPLAQLLRDLHDRIDQAVPTGTILMWSGSIGSIPVGFQLCNGTNGTPDLRNRFIVGAGATYTVGATGGANTVALAVGHLAPHDHGSASNHTHGSGSLGSDSAGAHGHGTTGSTTPSSAGAHTHGSHSHASGSLSTAARGAHSHSLLMTRTTSTNHNHVDTGAPDWFRSATRPSPASSNHQSSNAMNDAGNHSHPVSGSTSATTPSSQGGHTHGSHSHSTSSVSGHSHGVSGSTAAGGGHTHNSVGSGTAHENRPPYLALAFIQKM